jgi:hypothetical protein
MLSNSGVVDRVRQTDADLSVEQHVVERLASWLSHQAIGKPKEGNIIAETKIA